MAVVKVLIRMGTFKIAFTPKKNINGSGYCQNAPTGQYPVEIVLSGSVF